ncbi:hypothetical protein ACS0TY_025366 [Phlomoides rotata]
MRRSRYMRRRVCQIWSVQEPRPCLSHEYAVDSGFQGTWSPLHADVFRSYGLIVEHGLLFC